MDSLLCRASSFSISSSGRTSDSKNVVNSEEFVIEDFNKAIDNWELPKVNKEIIYKTKKLDFLKNDYVSIHTVTHAHNLFLTSVDTFFQVVYIIRTQDRDQTPTMLLNFGRILPIGCPL